ncbi:F-box protein [Auxenochlorella protothecoides]|uniref:F-box protein n=1 Tax=Auxenochlorella protothecoides TaxID=3075 RepID=A0A087SIV1_AUXPR|nr:F-box protein [Auxenochlorella protothecoides]KFM25655.1 F-box protein [Auxenochlorella protothecoides]
MSGPLDIQGLPVEVLARVFSGLPTDALQAVELVCRLWRSIVREADVWLAHPSLQPYPTLAEAARRLMLGRLVVEHPRSDADPLVHLPVGDREMRLVALVSCLGPDPASSLARNVLGASTTDHREESAINLLLPEERVTFGLGLSYWSSRGSPDPGSRDWVALRLAHPLVLVQEIRLRPFQAWFQPGGPVYAPVGVRFRIGGPMLFHPGSWQLGEAVLPQPGVAEVQAFRLPRPVLCVGGCVTVELLGKTQRQEEDGLLYVCLSYVHVVGRPLYSFAMDPWRREGGVALEALAVDPLTAQGGLQTMEKRLHAAVAMWHVQADRGAWLVPGEGWEAFRRGAD